jgi:hypothetical protein
MYLKSLRNDIIRYDPNTAIILNDIDDDFLADIIENRLGTLDEIIIESLYIIGKSVAETAIGYGYSRGHIYKKRNEILSRICWILLEGGQIGRRISRLMRRIDARIDSSKDAGDWQQAYDLLEQALDHVILASRKI